MADLPLGCPRVGENEVSPVPPPFSGLPGRDGEGAAPLTAPTRPRRPPRGPRIAVTPGTGPAFSCPRSCVVRLRAPAEVFVRDDISLPPQNKGNTDKSQHSHCLESAVGVALANALRAPQGSSASPGLPTPFSTRAPERRRSGGQGGLPAHPGVGCRARPPRNVLPCPPSQPPGANRATGAAGLCDR